jgi:hypothetical protein
MTVLLPDMTTRTVNGDSFDIDDEGNLVIASGSQPVACWSKNSWAAVWVTGSVIAP